VDLRPGSHAADRITDWRGTDTEPMWIGGSVYFLSDREDWKVNLWRYDVAAKTTSRVTHFTEYDVKWAHSGSGKIVFENGGALYLYDPQAGGEPRQVPVSLSDDERSARRRWIKVEERIQDASLGPDGQRALFTARGDLFTVPAEHGDIRNITRTQGVREKDAVWSPDGRWIAYFSDATGEEELYVVAQDGKSKPERLTHGPASWHFRPVWAADSTHLAYADRGMRLFWVSRVDKVPVQVTQARRHEIREYAWSPDSKWLAFATPAETDFEVISLYSMDNKAITPVTSDAFDSGDPVFDPAGKYLYLLSNRDVGPLMGGLEQSYTLPKMTRPHALVLRGDGASPFVPKSDEVKTPEERAKEDQEKQKEKEHPAQKELQPPAVRVDLAGIQERLVPFPVAPGQMRGLRVAKDKVYWLATEPMPLSEEAKPAQGVVTAFDFDKRKATEVLAKVEQYDVSRDGSRLLYKSEKTWGIAEIKEGLKVGDGALKLDDLKMELDPRAEWAQIFGETWRLYRDFFYLPDMGKVDWLAMRKRYEPLLAHVTHRFDLTYVLGELVGELGSGHSYVGGGDAAKPERVPIGTLGADLELDAKAGRWRIARILAGQNWVEGRRSPLQQPGVHVAPGEYLLAIDGQDLSPREEPYRLLAQTVGKTVTLTVGPRPSKEGAREVSIQPEANDWDLRYIDWVDSNRKKVDQATQGRVGYIHIPDMGAHGLKEFIRQYYPQVRKKGLIVDVRNNGGGFVAPAILERLRRSLIGMSNMRGQAPFTEPPAVFHGPMVAMADQYSASDGDIFPWSFRAYGLGPVIGKRTWGGTVGIRGVGSEMVDGGYDFVPEFGLYDLKSRWVAENEGVPPDIEVDNLPADLLAGRDPQLDRAIAETLKRVEAEKPSLPPIPASKDLRTPAPPPGSSGKP
jgi:tricorn protease